MRKRAATRPDTDFAAGHLELQKRTGAGLSLGAKAQPQYPSPPAAKATKSSWAAVRCAFVAAVTKDLPELPADSTTTLNTISKHTPISPGSGQGP